MQDVHIKQMEHTVMNKKKQSLDKHYWKEINQKQLYLYLHKIYILVTRP